MPFPTLFRFDFIFCKYSVFLLNIVIKFLLFEYQNTKKT